VGELDDIEEVFNTDHLVHFVFLLDARLTESFGVTGVEPEKDCVNYVWLFIFQVNQVARHDCRSLSMLAEAKMVLRYLTMLALPKHASKY
jgi:hypothetical protein